VAQPTAALQQGMGFTTTDQGHVTLTFLGDKC